MELWFFNSVILYAYFYLNEYQNNNKKETKLSFEFHIQYKGLDYGHMEHTRFR